MSKILNISEIEDISIQLYDDYSCVYESGYHNDSNSNVLYTDIIIKIDKEFDHNMILYVNEDIIGIDFYETLDTTRSNNIISDITETILEHSNSLNRYTDYVNGYNKHMSIIKSIIEHTNSHIIKVLSKYDNYIEMLIRVDYNATYQNTILYLSVIYNSE